MPTRVPCPPPFTLSFIGPLGPYTLSFEPIDDWDGSFSISGGEEGEAWSVLTIDRWPDGRMTLAGVTDGMSVSGGDVYWFDVQIEPLPAIVTLWGNQVLIRTDLQAG